MADQKTLWDHVSEEEIKNRLGSYRLPGFKGRGRSGMLTPEQLQRLMTHPEFLELITPHTADSERMVKQGPISDSTSSIGDKKMPTKPKKASDFRPFIPGAKNFPILAGIPQTGHASAYINRGNIERLLSNIIGKGEFPWIPQDVTTPPRHPDDEGKIGTVLQQIGSGKQGPAEEGIARGIDWGALIDIAIGLPGAERSQGFSSDVPSAIAQSAQEVYGARAAAAQNEQENMLEFYKEQLKNQPDRFQKVGAETTRLYTQLGNYKRGLGLIKRLKEIMSEGIGPTGGPGAGLNAIRNIASLFGVNLGETASGKVDLAAAELRKQLIASRVFGREANRTEQKLIKALVPMSGVFKNIDQLNEAYNALKEEMIRQANEVSSIMTNVYGLKPYGQVIFETPTASGDNIYIRPNSTGPKKIGNQ